MGDACRWEDVCSICNFGSRYRKYCLVSTAPPESRRKNYGRPIGKWGRMHRAYLEETNQLLLNHLILMGKLHAYLADLNEQAQNRYRLIVRQMADAEDVTEDLKRRSQWEWVKAMNSIVDRAEEIIRREMVCT